LLTVGRDINGHHGGIQGHEHQQHNRHQHRRSDEQAFSDKGFIYHGNRAALRTLAGKALGFYTGIPVAADRKQRM
jgi:hypothetical protein